MAPLALTIRLANGKRYPVTIDDGAGVNELKAAIAASEAQIPAGEQRLIYKGKVLKDDTPLSAYEIKDQTEVYLVRSLMSAGAASGAPQASQSSVPVATPVATTVTPQPAQGITPAQAQNPFALPGMAGLGGLGGMGDMADMQRMQQQLMSNPDAMANMLSNPLISSMLSNPEMIRTMMMSNPQMRQVLEANPQLNHVLNDPALMRQTMEYMRNPAAMREAMRSQDLAMSQIENLPGGFGALRRMYEEVQEPLMEATADAFRPQQPQTSSSSTSSASSAAPAPTSRPNTAALPNPWAAPSAATTTGGAAPGAIPGFPAFPMPQPTTTASSGTTGQQAPANPFNPFGGMPGGMPGAMGGAPADLESVMGMMQNPFMQTMMQQMMSSPAFLDQMTASNPQLRQMLETNPQLRQMLANPAFIQQVTNPDTLRAMSQLQRAGMLPGGAAPFGGTPGGMEGMPDFSALLGQQLPAPGATTGAAPAPVQDPTVRFADQLGQLRDMGFTDEQRNIEALTATMGNVNAAVERLLQ